MYIAIKKRSSGRCPYIHNIHIFSRKIGEMKTKILRKENVQNRLKTFMHFFHV